jgi:tetratricopeptide (TPR) repeat protein
VCEHRGLHLEGLDARRVGELLAVLLSKASEGAPLAVFFEDLHKAGPSTIHLLHETHRFLRALRRGHVLFFCTTRVAPMQSGEWNPMNWQEQLTAFLASEMTTRLDLQPLESIEAVEMLQRTVAKLGYADSQRLVEQVGCTPFGLHEAVAYLRTAGALDWDEAGHVAVADPEKLRSAMEVTTGQLEQVTAYRLTAVTGAGDEWLADFLDAGACLGRTFNVEVCLRAAGAPPARVADRALRRCERLAVLKASSTRAGDVQFDHDLLRRTHIREMGHLRQRQVAQRLFRQLGNSADDAMLAPLAYQAGLADAFGEHAMRHARRLQREQRHPEALRLLYMVVGSLDPELLVQLRGAEPASWMHGLDDALALGPDCRVGNIARAERDRRSLAVIRQLLPSLIAIGSGSSEGVERAVSEGRMLAERLRDREASAVLMYGYGRMLLERNRTWESIDEHDHAEAMFRELPQHLRSDERKQNLVRLGIGYRDTGRIQPALESFGAAMRLRGFGDWDLWGTVLANAGACHFYTNPATVRRYWARALRLGERKNLPDLRIHMEIDVGVLDLLDGDVAMARDRFLRALHEAEQYGMENQVLRSHLNLACLDLQGGDLVSAKAHLRESEQIGLAHAVGRRIWRVRANLATLCELDGDLAASAAYDTMVAEALVPVLQLNVDRLGGEGAMLNRAILPLGNLVLRAERSATHRALVGELDPVLRNAGTRLADGCRNDPGALPRRFGWHCKEVGGCPRFLITE